MHQYHKQLKFLKNCRGSKECNAINNPDNYYNYKNLNKKEEEEEEEDDDDEEEDEEEEDDNGINVPDEYYDSEYDDE